MTGRSLKILGKAPNNMELYEKYHVIFPVNFREFRKYLERLFFQNLADDWKVLKCLFTRSCVVYVIVWKEMNIPEKMWTPSPRLFFPLH